MARASVDFFCNRTAPPRLASTTSCHDLSQVVTEPTRGAAILDLVITNMQSFYNKPEIIAPIGTSDHNVIKWHPSDGTRSPRSTTTKCHLRRFPQSRCEAFGRWLTSQDWSANLPNPSANELASAFTLRVSQAIDDFFPLRNVKLHHSDKPWMTASLKNLIMERQRAFHCGNIHLWHYYRDKVKLEIISKKQKFYSDKVQHLKKTDTRSW